MKTTRFGLATVLLLSATSGIIAQENSFGVRAGSFQFPEAELFSESMFVEGPPAGRESIKLTWNREFEPEEFSGTLVEFYYSFRRDPDAHFQLGVSAGVFAKEASHIGPGNVVEKDNRGSGGEVNVDVPASVESTLEYTLYYAQVTPMYHFTTGKFRFFIGGGAGLWANFWREVVDANYPDIFSCLITDPIEACQGRINFRKSEGNRRTIVPLTVSAGFVYQFLPHWSVNLENRYLFNADSSVNLFRLDSNYTISGNQILLGFSYRL